MQKPTEDSARKLLASLDDVRTKSAGRRIVIVAHSHGAIVVKSVLDGLATRADRDLLRIVTIGPAQTLYHPAFEGRVRNFHFELTLDLTRMLDCANWETHIHPITSHVQAFTIAIAIGCIYRSISRSLAIACAAAAGKMAIEYAFRNSNSRSRPA